MTTDDASPDPQFDPQRSGADALPPIPPGGRATLEPGTRVENQNVPPDLAGTVVGPVPGMPGFVLVAWDDGRCFEEQVEDVTPR